ncbi:MAG TPA: sorbosone dehydrogenase family protein [Ferruginibacter sp.]|nr:sorbosone dehydrogenase family protein [Ferruginibacter sp.]
MNFRNLFFIPLIAISIPVFSQKDTLPPPNATKSSMNFSTVLGWKDGKMPQAPKGFVVTKFADGLQNPRWMCITPNGDVLVAESNSNFKVLEKAGAVVTGAFKAEDMTRSADRITLFRDNNGDGMPDQKDTLLTAANGLNQPFGMLIIGNSLYVANTDAVLRFPYKAGQTKITEVGQKIIDLPAGKSFKLNRHWTRNLIANADNSKIYIAVGSSSNIGENGLEKELLRASILEMNPDGSGMRVYASGLRNPVGMGWPPGTTTLWTTVNERDELGDDLVPDYLTSVKSGGFYGWPYAYFGQHIDARVEQPQLDLVKKSIVPDVDLGSHTASLGLVFYTKKSFPAQYQGGAFIAQHGSWNRSVLSGYKVVYVPFQNGKATGRPQDFLTGFIADLSKNRVYGRPVGLAVLPDGSLLVTDDASEKIWRVSVEK